MMNTVLLNIWHIYAGFRPHTFLPGRKFFGLVQWTLTLNQIWGDWWVSGVAFLQPEPLWIPSIWKSYQISLPHTHTGMWYLHSETISEREFKHHLYSGIQTLLTRCLDTENKRQPQERWVRKRGTATHLLQDEQLVTKKKSDHHFD